MARKGKPPPPPDFGSPDWLPVNDAFARFRDNRGSRDLAAAALHQALIGGLLASRLALFQRTAPRAAGQHVWRPPTGQPEQHVLPPKFWRQYSLTAASNGNGVSCQPAKGFKTPSGWDAGYFFVRRSDLDALLPPSRPQAEPSPVTRRPAKTWAKDITDQMKEDGTISKGITRRRLAKKLEERMQAEVEADPSRGEAYGFDYLRLHVEEWGLWPVKTDR